MSRVAANADDYAAGRQNIFFTANNTTPADGNLTGQCVTLVKWFLSEMTDVPNPFAARGDARYVGKRLVAEGLADEVPYDQRQAGDIICLEYGTYGHIYVQLTGGRVFEENVNIGGVARKLVDGAYVYASRIGSDSEAWRHDFHAYRIKGYNDEGADMKTTANNLKYLYLGVYAQDTPDDVLAKDPLVGTDLAETALQILDYANKNGFAYWQYKPKAEKTIADLKAQVAALQKQVASGGTAPSDGTYKLTRIG